jgi:hypothetical protein
MSAQPGSLQARYLHELVTPTDYESQPNSESVSDLDEGYTKTAHQKSGLIFAKHMFDCVCCVMLIFSFALVCVRVVSITVTVCPYHGHIFLCTVHYSTETQRRPHMQPASLSEGPL